MGKNSGKKGAREERRSDFLILDSLVLKDTWTAILPVASGIFYNTTICTRRNCSASLLSPENLRSGRKRFFRVVPEQHQLAMAAVSCYSGRHLPMGGPTPFLGRSPSFLVIAPFSLHLRSSSSLLFLRRGRSSHFSPNSRNSVSQPKINAVFWGPKRTAEPHEMDLSLETFSLTGSAPEVFLSLILVGYSVSKELSANGTKPQKISLSVISSISEVASEEWDACATDATGPGKLNPFLTHVMEEDGLTHSQAEVGQRISLLVAWCFSFSKQLSSYTVHTETGWVPRHLIAQDEYKTILGVVPLYLKSHSYGEFVFDYSWADAYYSYGAQYYPKLQCCVPFTPVTGQRILVRNTWCKDKIFDRLVSAMKEMTAKVPHRIDLVLGGLIEIDFPPTLFHTHNTVPGLVWSTDLLGHYHATEKMSALTETEEGTEEEARSFIKKIELFDEFLMDMKQSKRKNIRQERKKISAQNLTMKRLRGDEIKAKHWDSFYEFYRNTTDNKWGRAFLTRDFFHIMGSKMGDRVLLVVAEDGAILTFFQAIEAAIELNLDKVEAGAQGEHKIQRGYSPATTYSCHYILDGGFRKAIEEFLVREADQGEKEKSVYMPKEVGVPIWLAQWQAIESACMAFNDATKRENSFDKMHFSENIIPREQARHRSVES
ncbi:hypothetical protein ACLOJK_014173 [Asimina triloba]